MELQSVKVRDWTGRAPPSRMDRTEGDVRERRGRDRSVPGGDNSPKFAPHCRDYSREIELTLRRFQNSSAAMR